MKITLFEEAEIHCVVSISSNGNEYNFDILDIETKEVYASNRVTLLQCGMFYSAAMWTTPSRYKQKLNIKLSSARNKFLAELKGYPLHILANVQDGSFYSKVLLKRGWKRLMQTDHGFGLYVLTINHA